MENLQKPDLDEGQSSSVKGRLTNFADQTSMHGLAKVTSGSIVGRCFWALLVLGAAGFASYNVINVIQTYMGNPVSTVVSVEYADNLDFPAVTVCNLNMIRKEKWDNISRIILKIQEGGLAGTTEAPTTQAVTGTTEEYDFYEYDYSPTEVYDLQSRVQAYLSQLNLTQRATYGHKIEAMLFGCVFRRQQCLSKNFTQFYNSMYGNCYTFNTEFDDLGISRPGPSHGLSLLLNAQEDQYTELTYTVGFKIVVHPADSMPFPEDEGIMVSPGHTTNIAISKMEIKRAGPPYGKCNTFTDEEGDHLNMYGAIYDKKYTDNACRRTCYQKYVNKECGCCDPDYPCRLITPDGYEETVVPCNTTDSYTVECVQMVLKDYQAGDLGCGEICPPACEEVIYSPEVSTGLFPAKIHQEAIRDAFLKSNPGINTSLVDIDYIRRNVAKVELFFKELNYEYIVTTPAYDWYRLLGDLGGQLGLWLGFSLLTAFEFLELMAGICRHVTHKLFCRSHQGRRVDVAAAK